MAIKEHERNTIRVLITTFSAIRQGRESIYGPDVIPRTITGSHGVSTRDLVIQHILRVISAGLSAGLGLLEALFTISVHERDTGTVAVSSVGTLR